MTAIIYYDRFEQSEKVMCETFYKSYHNGVVRPFSTTGTPMYCDIENYTPTFIFGDIYFGEIDFDIFEHKNSFKFRCRIDEDSGLWVIASIYRPVAATRGLELALK